MAILTAVAALKASGISPTANIKFFFEGEEEAGSSHLGEIIRLHKELLAVDAWIICDGPVHQSGRKQAVFGVRGDTNVDVTVYGASRPLHSGHYGNWSPNPANTLVRLLASMKDDAGRVTIAGWYDDVEPIGEAERRAIAEAPQYDDELRATTRAGANRRRGQEPAGINQPAVAKHQRHGSGDVGALARNVIPTTATAVLDLRLVKGNDYRRQVERLVAHIRKQGFYVIDRDPTDRRTATESADRQSPSPRRWLQRRTHAHGSADLASGDRGGAINFRATDRQVCRLLVAACRCRSSLRTCAPSRSRCPSPTMTTTSTLKMRTSDCRTSGMALRRLRP